MTEKEILRIKRKKFDSPIKLVQELPDELPYIHNCCKNSRTVLHNGQRKLFNTLLAFLNKYYDKDIETCLYIGSSPGQNIAAVAELFPKVKFYLYDGKHTKTKQLPNVEIVRNDKNEGVKFTDYVLSQFLNRNASTLLFSDIRNVDNKGNVTEEIVDSDLNLQLSWITKLKPKAFCLKFRLPYVDPNKSKTTFKEYVDGLGILQPYAPESTTEIRLMNESSKIFDNKGNLKLIKWSLTTHENRMFYLNILIREWAYYTNVDDDVIGGDNCFDCALETDICKKFLVSYPNTVQKFSKQEGKTDVSKFRNWISNYNEKLKLICPEQPKIPKEFRLLKFEKTKVQCLHGRLPILDRSVKDFLQIVSPINLFTDIICKRAKIDLTYEKIKSLIKKNESLIYEAITHKSMNKERNYERLEFRGDRILSDSISEFFYHKSTSNDISILNGLLSAFTSGETAADLFSEKLGLKQIIIINEEECCIASAAEDVFEASLAAINIIFNTEYSRGIGSIVCYNIISSILNEIDFCDFKLRIFPPKTELKELFNEHQHEGFIFDKQYSVTVGDGKFKDIHDNTPEKIRVEIKFPPEIPTSLIPPVYEEYGSKARVERNACELYLEFFKNRGYVPKPKNRDLGLGFRC
jgi:dsRNA-specific ribonuclease